MATYTTSKYDAQKYARTNPARFPNANTASGAVQMAIVPYTLTGAEANADIINLCILPAGAVPIPSLSRVICSGAPAPSGTLTINVGTLDPAAPVPDGWAKGIDLKNGGTVEFTSAAITTLPWFIAETPLVADTSSTVPGGGGNCVISATVVSAGSLTSKILYFHLAYKLGS